MTICSPLKMDWSSIMQYYGSVYRGESDNIP